MLQNANTGNEISKILSDMTGISEIKFKINDVPQINSNYNKAKFKDTGYA